MGAMKHLLAFGLLLAAVGCGGGGGGIWEDSSGNYDDVTAAPMVTAGSPTEVDLQYLALCIEESKAVCNWQDSEGSASSAGSAHSSKTFGHRTQILMRQKPWFPMVPDYPKKP